jgi:DNA adenine methylase
MIPSSACQPWHADQPGHAGEHGDQRRQLHHATGHDLLSALRPVTPVKPVAAYVGGKKLLARRLVAAIEATPHGLYAEPFVGMGGVFLRRRLAPKVEAINDLSRDVATFFRVLQRHYQALMDMLKWQLTSRAEFDRLMAQEPDTLTDLERAARFLYLQRLAFGGKVAGRTFGMSTTEAGRFDITKLGGLLEAAHERLAGVWIDCLPWRTFLDRWDRPDTLFYVDPPYWGTEHFYGRHLFAPADHEALAAALKGLRGRFILTLNDVPEVQALYRWAAIEPAELHYRVSGEVTPARELIIRPKGRRRSTRR